MKYATLIVIFVEKAIYWVDGYLDCIYTSDYGGNDRNIFLQVKKGIQMTDIDLVDDYLYFTASGKK